MSPLALYIEQVSYHEPLFSPPKHPTVSVYPPSPPSNPIFDSLHSSPMLEKSRTNRVLTYAGSFNPPHRGHLHLLKHAFTRGTHDLNVIAAIILPRSDESVARKVKAENGKFMFGIDERSLLWKQDICFPPWAWVYNDSTTSFTKFSQRLIQATGKDGYILEFVPLYGAEIASPSSPPDPVYGCKTIIMCDAARAATYQSSSGRLRDIYGCTKWRGIGINKDRLRQEARFKVGHTVLAMKTIFPQEASSMLRDGMSEEGSPCSKKKLALIHSGKGRAYFEEATETYLAKACEELKAVVTCKRQLGSQKLTLRFVKCDNVDPRADYNDISSTILRKVMRTKKGVKLREALDWIALSADLLWHYKDCWIDKARRGTGCCIKFDSLPDFPASYEDFRSYEKPPHFDDPPSLEELGLVEVFEESPSIEDAPSLESPKLEEESPTVEEPQSLKEPTQTNHRKRRFSATGLDDGCEILKDSAGGGLLAKDTET